MSVAIVSYEQYKPNENFFSKCPDFHAFLNHSCYCWRTPGFLELLSPQM